MNRNQSNQLLNAKITTCYVRLKRVMVFLELDVSARRATSVAAKATTATATGTTATTASASTASESSSTATEASSAATKAASTATTATSESSTTTVVTSRSCTTEISAKTTAKEFVTVHFVDSSLSSIFAIKLDITVTLEV